MKIVYLDAVTIHIRLIDKIYDFADMAQSVERILGKDEVPSSILGISTTYSVSKEFVWKP